MITLKAFTIQKDGEPFTNQDRLAVAISKRRFAVADGVSNSYYPEIIAEALCQGFINERSAIVDWPAQFENHVSKDISAIWAKEIDAIESELDELDFRHAQIQREELPNGASTFAGIEVDEMGKEVFYHIVGDSCLFVLPDNEPMQIYTTCPKTVRDGKPFYQFKTDTHAIVAERNEKVQWLSGTASISSGYVMLMTDGAAKWFQDTIYIDSGVAQMLWKINDHVQFEELVKKGRQQNQMDDDITIVMLKFDGKLGENIVPLMVDVWEWYPNDLIQLESFPAPIQTEEEFGTNSIAYLDKKLEDVNNDFSDGNGSDYYFVKLIGFFKSVWRNIFGPTKTR